MPLATIVPTFAGGGGLGFAVSDLGVGALRFLRVHD